MTAMGMAIRWWCALAALMLLALARPAEAREPEVSVESVRFGFTGSPVGERWMPVRVRITPGAEPMQGQVIVETQQDATQSARFIAPIALVPGSAAEITLPVLMRREADDVTIRVEARGASSSVSVRRTLVRFGGPDEARLPRALSPEAVVVVSAGEGAPPRDTAITQALGPSPFQPVAARVDLNQLPDAWAAYQSVDLLIVRGADAARLEPRVLAALRQWVLWGGRLLIVADSPGEEWSRWLPGGPEFPVKIAEVARAGTLWVGPPELPSADVYAEAPRRGLSLTGLGKRDGWRLAMTSRGDTEGLLATGPVGLGVVGVLGVDPSRAMIPGAGASLEKLWAQVLASMDLRQPPTATASWRMASGEDSNSSAALSGVMNAVVRIEPIGVGTAILLGSILLVLAVILGPGDRYILGRLGLRHRSWLSAVLWIGLASAAMLLIPEFVRRTPTTISRVRVIDQVCADAGSTPGQVAFLTDVRVTFAASSTRATLQDLPAGGFTRGVSATGARDNSLGGPSALPLICVPAAIDPRPEPWGALSPGNAAESGAVTPAGGIDFRRWSLRAVMTMARVAPPVTAVALQPGTGRTLRVMGIDPSSRLLTTAVHGSGGNDFEVRHASLVDGTLELVLGEQTPGTPQQSVWGSIDGSSIGPMELSAYALCLPGTGQREASLKRRIASGRWAVVEALMVDKSPPELLSGAGNTESITLLRLVVPAESWGQPPSQEKTR